MAKKKAKKNLYNFTIEYHLNMPDELTAGEIKALQDIARGGDATCRCPIDKDGDEICSLCKKLTRTLTSGGDCPCHILNDQFDKQLPRVIRAFIKDYKEQKKK